MKKDMGTYIVYKKIVYSKSFCKVIALKNGQFKIIILRNIENMKDIKDIKSNSIIKVIGFSHIFKGQEEVVAKEIMSLGKINPIIPINTKKMEQLFVRQISVAHIHSFFKEKQILAVQSPSIVSKWVDGKTTAFKVKYYGENRFLSISNMIYHQLLIANGMTDIYELGKLHREELSSGRNKLSEFTTLDISKIGSNIKEICDIFEELICSLKNHLEKYNYKDIKIIDKVYFESIDYNELLKKSEVNHFSGSQLPKKCRDYLNRNYSSFVWVYNFDISKRPFYTKVQGDKTKDVQLWFKGIKYFAAGSEIETDYQKILDNLVIRNRNKDNYRNYLRQAKKGLPPMSMIGMGFEMLLSCIIYDSNTIDFSFFPRTDKMDFF